LENTVSKEPCKNTIARRGGVDLNLASEDWG